MAACEAVSALAKAALSSFPQVKQPVVLELAIMDTTACVELVTDTMVPAGTTTPLPATLLKQLPVPSSTIPTLVVFPPVQGVAPASQNEPCVIATVVVLLKVAASSCCVFP